ncbi:hypothetical protein Q7P36_005228 [Cladosporium allicinum]
MAFSLDHHFLRNTHPREAGPYLHNIAQKRELSTTGVSQELLDAIAIESLPPRVYKLWLCACPDTTAIILGLRQTHSNLIRTAAIRAFHRWFRTAKCVDIWNDLGGTEGIVDMLATFSVNHVTDFSKQVGRCNNSQTLRDERQGLATDLMYSLASRFFPESANVSNPDRRPLLDSYARLVYACTPEARDAWIGMNGLPELDFSKVMQTDTEHYQRQCLEKVGTGGDDIWKYSELLISLPPGRCSDDPDLPMSTLFAAKLLENLGPHEENSKNVLKLGGALRTILRRLARRNVSNSMAIRVVGLIYSRAKNLFMHHLKTYGNTLDEYRIHLKDVARLWGRDPDEMEPLLSALLRKSKIVKMTNVVATVSMVSVDKRYRLLRWLMLHEYDIDVDNLSKASLEHLRIPLELFTLLSKDKARDLLERLATLDNSKVWLTGAHFHTMPVTDSIDTPFDIVRCLLLEDREDRLGGASSRVQIYKRMAEKERDPIVRIEWVVASAAMSVTSGSLDLLRETLIWARRYNRDPNVSNFYGQGSILSESDTISLLSGIPEKSTVNADPDSIATDIRKGNDIALLLLETAAMCQTEPSFYVNHWVEVQHLFVDIVECRLNRVKHLQSRLGVSDDEIYDIVWKHTLESLLAAERLGIDEKNEALQFTDMRGPLAVWEMWANELEVKDPSLSTLRFIDELAKQRDQLWEEHRPSVHPGVAALQSPWPRGLPVQALLQVDIDAELSHTLLPFIRQRARDIVFAAPEKVLTPIPEDRDTRAAIGCFVDEYSAALKIHVSWCSAEEKQRRIQEAWQYATTSLCKDRLSSLEARRYWEKVFAEADSEISASMLNYPERPSPELPPMDPQDRQEWNPDAGPHPANIQEQALDVFCLDCMTAPAYGKSIFDTFVKPKPSIKPLDFPDFWDLERFGSLVPPEAEEAFIASALLLVDTLSQADSKILSTPFPDEDARLPAAYLDSEFADQQRSFDNIPLKLLANTPPTLLDQLTAALIPKLSGSRTPPPATIKWAFKALKLLAWSDNPGLAIRHIVHVVVNLPEHSSWHRVLLHTGILKRLSKEQSKELLTGLADAINEKNRKRGQAVESRETTSEGSETQTKSQSKDFVKVTTVKLLAQLMSHAKYVDETFCVEVLVKLLRASTHIDIRASIATSLIDIVATTTDPSIEEAVILTLESEVLPIAAQLSEGHVMTEEDWTKCEDEKRVPESDLETPVYDILIWYVKEKRTDKLKTRELVNRLLLPLVEQMASIGHRWIKALLRANNLADLAGDIPRAFGSHELLNTLLHCFPSHMPADYFRDLQDLMLYFHDPPKGLRDLKNDTSSVRASKLLGHSRWISKDTSLLTNLNIPDLLKTADFATAEDAAANDLLTPTQLQAYERLMIDKLLERYDERAKAWSSLTSRYTPPLRFKESMLLRWQTHCKPLITYMIDRIETTRTPEWQRNPLRRPARLPDTFQLRLWLLTYVPAKPHQSEPRDEARREKFASELRDIVKELAASGRPYHARFAQVIEAAKLCYDQEWVALASRLGAVEREQEGREFTLEELLLVEFADELLKGMREPEKCPGLKEVREMLAGSWGRCVDEEVRDRGLALKKDLRG